MSRLSLWVKVVRVRVRVRVGVWAVAIKIPSKAETKNKGHSPKGNLYPALRPAVLPSFRPMSCPRPCILSNNKKGNELNLTLFGLMSFPHKSQYPFAVLRPCATRCHLTLSGETVAFPAVLRQTSLSLEPVNLKKRSLLASFLVSLTFCESLTCNFLLSFLLSPSYFLSFLPLSTVAPGPRSGICMSFLAGVSFSSRQVWRASGPNLAGTGRSFSKVSFGLTRLIDLRRVRSFSAFLFFFPFPDFLFNYPGKPWETSTRFASSFFAMECF